MNRKEAYKIDRLQKRADHLRGRVAAAEADGRDLTFDKAELSALLWAIPRLLDYERLDDEVRTLTSQLDGLNQ